MHIMMNNIKLVHVMTINRIGINKNKNAKVQKSFKQQIITVVWVGISTKQNKNVSYANLMIIQGNAHYAQADCLLIAINAMLDII